MYILSRLKFIKNYGFFRQHSFLEGEFEGTKVVVQMSNVHEGDKLDLGNGSHILSFSDDKSEVINFFGINGGQNSSGGGDLEGAGHGVVTNSEFTGAFFPIRYIVYLFIN